MAVLLARHLLKSYDQLIVNLILRGSSPYTALSLYGVGSQSALGTTIGLF